MPTHFKKLLSRPGQRYVLPALHGSADSLAIARAASELKAQNRMLVVVTAKTTDARRILEEVPWFHQNEKEPLLCHLLPDWETLPYDTFLLIRIWYHSDWKPYMKFKTGAAIS